jgi:hypothetical protein
MGFERDGVSNVMEFRTGGSFERDGVTAQETRTYQPEAAQSA